MSSPSQVIVIVEDANHRMLVYRYLRGRGCNRYAIRIERSPAGEGSAERWVRARFAKEVRVFRSRIRHAETALIVIIDADAFTIQHRLQQLDQALTDSGQALVNPESEEIARLVPKRNIETWIMCLNGEPVDEDTNYKPTRNDWTALIPSAAATLVAWAHSGRELADHCVDSLRAAIGELKRLSL